MTAQSTSALWTSAEIATATDAAIAGTWDVTGVSIDSRTIEAGDLFVAVAGENFDGHDYVGAALDKGAAGALVERDIDGAAADRLARVGDTMVALEKLAQAARARSAAKIAAVTGSVGKTTTKDGLAQALSASGATHASAGNLNNHIGAPLSLARFGRDAAFGVFELGMNHPGEIAPLSKLVRPHAAIVTNVTTAHLEFFADEGGIADEKATICDGLEPGGVAVLNRDSVYFERMAAHARTLNVGRVVGFGEHPMADAKLVDVTMDADGTTVEARFDGQTLRYRLGGIGRHLALNSLGILAAAAALGTDLQTSAAALAAWTPRKGRGGRETLAWAGGSIVLIDESYNASPSAVEAAIAVLGAAVPGAGGRRILVLGDMRELGPTASDLHGALAPSVVAAGIDRVYTAGPLSAALHDRLPAAIAAAHAATSADLIDIVPAALTAGDVVTVKGSLGSRMAPVVEAIRTTAARLQTAETL